MNNFLHSCRNSFRFDHSDLQILVCFLTGFCNIFLLRDLSPETLLRFGDMDNDSQLYQTDSSFKTNIVSPKLLGLDRLRLVVGEGLSTHSNPKNLSFLNANYFEVAREVVPSASFSEVHTA